MNRTVTILLVEDDIVDVMGIQRGLKKHKVANPTVHASNGREALDIMRGNGHPKLQRPYLVLCDINMPEMNGLEFLDELRQDKELSDTVVFMLTTSKADEDRISAYAHHVAGYIVKSDAGSEFLRLISMLDMYWKIVEMP
ncbi:MAG: response regulator [Planctomycetes bacterium]|nr:response regulator [Planctomycetota bacterium]